MTYLGLLIALGLVLSCVLILIDQKAWEGWRPACKISAAAVFVLMGLHSDFQRPQDYWMMTGLIFGFIGDVALLWRDRVIFLGGLIAFLLGHVFYVLAWAPAWQGSALTHPLTWLFLLISLGFTPYIWRFVHGHMRLAVCAYIGVITLMGLSSVGQMTASGDWRFGVGALMFVCSDLSVALDRFTALPRWHRIAGIPLYFWSQYLIASTLIW